MERKRWAQGFLKVGYSAVGRARASLTRTKLSAASSNTPSPQQLSTIRCLPQWWEPPSPPHPPTPPRFSAVGPDKSPVCFSPQQPNIKQKFVALLKRFKVSDEVRPVLG